MKFKAQKGLSILEALLAIAIMSGTLLALMNFKDSQKKMHKKNEEALDLFFIADNFLNTLSSMSGQEWFDVIDGEGGVTSYMQYGGGPLITNYYYAKTQPWMQEWIDRYDLVLLRYSVVLVHPDFPNGFPASVRPQPFLRFWDLKNGQEMGEIIRKIAVDMHMKASNGEIIKVRTGRWVYGE
jgi:type II secretory pathway pseudopilin PulG